MDLPKREKKIARALIDKGLNIEFANALDEFHEILVDWKSNSKDNKESYHKIYRAVIDNDKHIGRRYDGLTGSRYFITVVSLYIDGIISDEDINDFSEETKEKIKRMSDIYK